MKDGKIILPEGNSMKNFLIDTDILSMFMKNNNNVVENFRIHFNNFDSPCFSILTYYEILSGLKYKDSKKQLSQFLDFMKNCVLLNLNNESIEYSSNIYAALRKKGMIIDDVDILIAGICMANDLVLVTNNNKHYSNIDGLKIENWSL